MSSPFIPPLHPNLILTPSLTSSPFSSPFSSPSTTAHTDPITRNALRASQTKKLAELLRRKFVVEKKMLQLVQNLDEAYKNGARELVGVARGRRKEMEKLCAIGMTGVKRV